MKESNVEWVGQIPDSWRIERLQWHLSEIKESNNPVQTEQILSLTNKLGVIPYEEKGAQGNKSKTNVAEYKLAYPNTIVANSMNILIGSVGISDYFGCVSPVYYVFKADSGSNIQYINYIFQTTGFQRELRKFANGILEIRLRVSADSILKRTVPFPPEDEQKKIVDFLNEKCIKLDGIFAKIAEQIEILIRYKHSIITETVFGKNIKHEEKKNSAIEWIGDIPESYCISRIKYEIEPLNRMVKEDDEIITCFRDGEVTLRKKRREDGFTVSFTEHGYQGVEKGDLVIHGMDAFAGSIGCSDCRGKTTPVVHVCKTTGNNRYFMYFLRSMAYNNVFQDFSYGIRIRSSDFRNFARLGELPIVVPDIEEQNRIVNFLDEQCLIIDSLIEKKKNQMDIVSEYKESLIYEYVTGKKEVPA